MTKAQDNPQNGQYRFVKQFLGKEIGMTGNYLRKSWVSIKQNGYKTAYQIPCKLRENS